MSGDNASLTKTNFLSQGTWYESHAFAPAMPRHFPSYGTSYPQTDGLPPDSPPFSILTLPLTGMLPVLEAYFIPTGDLATTPTYASTITYLSFAKGVANSATFAVAPAAGDLLLCFAVNNASTPPVNAPWIFVDGLDANYGTLLAYKICGAGESTVQSPVSGGVATNITIGQFRSSVGFASNPIDKHAIVESITASPPSVITTSVTPSNVGCAAFLGAFEFAVADVSPSTISGMDTIQLPNSQVQGGPTGHGIVAFQRNIGSSSYSKTIPWTGATTQSAVGAIVTFIDNVSIANNSTVSGTFTPTGSLRNAITTSLAAGNANFTGSLSTLYTNNSSTITFVQVATGNTASVIFHSGAPAQGDLLLCSAFNNATPPTANTGWNAIDSNSGAYGAATFYKICGASESTTQTPIVGTSSNVTVAQFHSSLGFGSNPIDQHNITNHATANPPTVTTTSVNPTYTYDAAFIAGWEFATADTSPTTISGMTTVARPNSPQQSGPTGDGIAAYQLGVGTSSYSKTLAWTGTTTQASIATLITFYDTSSVANNSTLTGALSFSGAQNKATATARSAAATFTGPSHLSNAVAKGVTAAANFTGPTTLKNSISKLITAGVLTFSGAVSKTHSVLTALSGSISFAGAKVVATSKGVAGALTFSGAKQVATSKHITAAATFAGSCVKGTSRALSGALTFVGSRVDAIVYPFTAALTFSGARQVATSKHMTAAANFIGSYAKATSRILSGALTFVGSRVDSITYPLTAALTFAGSTALVKSLHVGLTASAQFTGSLKKDAARALTGALSFVGTKGVSVAKNLTAAGNFTGSCGRGIVKHITAALTPVGSYTASASVTIANVIAKFDLTVSASFSALANSYTKSLTGALTFTSTSKHSIARALSAALNFTGAIASVSLIVKGLTAALTFSGTHSTLLGKAFSAALACTGSINKAISKAFSGALTLVAPLNLSITQYPYLTNGEGYRITNGNSDSISVLFGVIQFLTASLSFVGAKSIALAKNLAAVAQFTGTISKASNKAITGTLTFTGSQIRAISKGLSASLTFVGSRVDSIVYLMTAALTFAGAKRTDIAKSLPGALTFVGSATKATTKAIAGTLSFIGSLVSSSIRLENLTAALTFIGAKRVDVVKHITAAAQFTGPTNLVKAITKSLATGTLTLGGAVAKGLRTTLTGVLQPTGSITKNIHLIATNFTGALTFIGSRVDAIQMFFTAALSFSSPANLQKSISKAISGALSFVINFSNGGATTKAFTAALSFIGAKTNAISTHLAGSVSASGTYRLDISTHLASVLRPVGNLIKSTIRALTAALTFNGTTTRLLTKVFAAVLQQVGTIRKDIGTHLNAALTFATIFNTGSSNHFTQSLAGAITFTTSQGRAISTHLTAALTSVGNIGKSITKLLTNGALTFSGVVGKASRKGLSSALTFTSNSSHAISTHFQGALTFTGLASKGLRSTLSASIRPSGSITKALGRSLNAALTFSGNYTRKIGKSLTATLSLVGPAIRPIVAVVKFITDAILDLDGVMSHIGPEKDNFISFEALLTPSGTIRKDITNTFSAAITFVGRPIKNISKNLQANLSLASSLGRTITMAITQIIETAKTIWSFVFSGMPSPLRKISSQGSSVTAMVSAVFPSSFSSSLAKAFIGIVGNTSSSVNLEFQLAVYTTTLTTYRISMPMGTIVALMNLLPAYHNKQMSGSTWSFDFKDAMDQPFHITLDSDDLTSLLSLIEFAQAGGVPGTLEGTVMVTYNPIAPQSDSNSEGNADPVSPYDD